MRWIGNHEVRSKERKAAQLVARGHASLKELLTLNYGEWPLRGLDIVSDEHLDRTVSLLPMANLARRVFTDPDITSGNFIANLKTAIKALTTDSGRAWIHGKPTDKREIWINRFRIKYNFLRTGQYLTNSILAHERRHVQHADAVIPARASDIFGETFVRMGAAANVQGASVVDHFVSSLLYQHINGMGTIRRALQKVSDFNRWRKGNLKSFKNQMNYLLAGVEMQARIEEILVAGYPKWPQMPLTREELWAAMAASGLRQPRKLRKQMAADSKYQEAREKFSAKLHTQTAAHQINWAIQNLPSKSAQSAFWLEMLPMLYSDILESMGDRHGRERMGFGVNQSLPLFLFGKIYDACQKGKLNPEINKLLFDKVKIFGTENSASFIEGFYRAHSVSPQDGEKRTVAPAEARFMSAIANTSDVMEHLKRHDASILKWLDAPIKIENKRRTDPGQNLQC